LYEQFSFYYDQIQPETKLELELGMNSREMVELVNECEIIFNIKINLDDIDKIIEERNPIIIQDVVDYIKEQISLNKLTLV
jgi:acyl carrier protein